MPLVEDDKYEQMPISRTTNVHNLAATIAKVIQRGKTIRLVAIGAGAVNQMTKATCVCLTYLAPSGISVVWRHYFTDRAIPEELVEELKRQAEAEGIPFRSTWSAVVMESIVISGPPLT